MPMTVLQIIQETCKYVGLAVPTAVFSSTVREHVELASFINEMGGSIAFDTGDWSKLTAFATITGDGATQAWPLPTDYSRMLKRARLWPSWMPVHPLTHYPDIDQWLGLQVQSFRGVIGAWTKLGGNLLFNPVIPNAATVKFAYIKNTFALKADATPQTSFLADTDTYVLDDGILKLGLIYYWKAQKGQLYNEDLANFEVSLATEAGNDKGSNILTVGAQRMPMGVSIAYPGVL